MANRSFIGGYGVTFYIDATDFMDKVQYYREKLSKPQFERMMKNVLYDVGRRAPVPIAREQTKKYAVTQAWVKGQIRSPRIDGNSLVIPLKGPKGSIGGTFRARARKRGKVGGRSAKGRIVTSIVKGQQSLLPDAMVNQGGNPPFMIRNAKTGGKNVAFTRRGPGRFPIVAVKGMAAPQMPLNLAAEGTQDRLLEIAEERLEHNFQRLFK